MLDAQTELLNSTRAHATVTSSDEESAAQLEEFMAQEGDPAHQQEASCQSGNQAKDYQHGPETPKHCRGEREGAGGHFYSEQSHVRVVFAFGQLLSSQVLTQP